MAFGIKHTEHSEKNYKNWEVMVPPKYVNDKRLYPFKWKIDGYSIIANRGADTYYSQSFAACGFNWKLRLESVLEEDGEKHIGLYLSHDGVSKNSVIKAIYKLFIYDQLHMEHIQMEGEDCFHSPSRHGFCCKVSLNKFNNVKYGLLVHDRCMFGVELLEASEIHIEGISEYLSLKKESPVIYTWVIKDFLSLDVYLSSKAFAAGGYKWRIKLYPNLPLDEDLLCVSLDMDNADSLASKTSVYVDFIISLLNQHNAKHFKRTVKRYYSIVDSSWEWNNFLSWEDVQDPSRGFFLNDTLIIEATVTVLGVVTFA